MPDEAIVIRVGPEKGPYFANEIDDPIPELFEGAFTLSSSDLGEDPPLLSVYDNDLTSVLQAKAILGRDKASAFALNVKEIRAVESEGAGKLDVFRSPIELSKAHMPGSDGHCGISGLNIPGNSKTAKRQRRSLREELVRICQKAEG